MAGADEDADGDADGDAAVDAACLFLRELVFPTKTTERTTALKAIPRRKNIFFVHCDRQKD
jgi:hypothetical protein